MVRMVRMVRIVRSLADRTFQLRAALNNFLVRRAGRLDAPHHVLQGIDLLLRVHPHLALLVGGLLVELLDVRLVLARQRRGELELR